MLGQQIGNSTLIIKMKIDIANTLRRGVSAHRKDELELAEECYQKILQIQPDHPDANHNLGVLYFSTDQKVLSLSYFEKAFNFNPSIEQFCLSYVEALTELNHLETVHSVLMEAKASGLKSARIDELSENLFGKSPNLPKEVKLENAKALEKLLEAYKKRDYEKAKEYAIQITEKRPETQIAWKVLGSVLHLKGQHADALRCLKKAATLGDSDADVHFNLGLISQELNKNREAKLHYHRAIDLKPDFVEARTNLGIVLQQLGELKLAKQAFEYALSIRPDFYQAHNNLGITLKKMGFLREARSSYKRAIELYPNYADAHNNLGITFQELNDHQMAESHLRKALAIEPTLFSALNNLGISLQSRRNFGEAEECFRKAIELHPNFPEAFNNLALVLKDQNKADDAIALLRHALSLNPNYSEASTNLGVLLYQKGNTELAVKQFENARVSSDDPRLQELLITILKARMNTTVQHSFPSVANIENSSDVDAFNTYVTSRAVEAELEPTIAGLHSRAMDEAKNTPVFGNGRCSLDYALFDLEDSVLQSLEEDLIGILKERFHSDIFIYDSFFNIYSSGSGIPPHSHLNRWDKEAGLDLAKQKYSLVYYVSVGDQSGDTPGALNLFDPEEVILPADGMVVIFPAGRIHSAEYRGERERILIGVNFYIY